MSKRANGAFFGFLAIFLAILFGYKPVTLLLAGSTDPLTIFDLASQVAFFFIGLGIIKLAVFPNSNDYFMRIAITAQGCIWIAQDVAKYTLNKQDIESATFGVVFDLVATILLIFLFRRPPNS